MNLEKLTQFLIELEFSNSKAWFDQNRPRYLELRLEFIDFVAEVIAGVSSFDASVKGIRAKDCLFRINRDVRFSHNKNPYKTNFSAALSAGGRHSNYPIYYVQLGIENSVTAGGIHAPPNEQLALIRRFIERHPKKADALLRNKALLEEFAAEGRGIQQHGATALCHHRRRDSPGYNVTRGKLTVRMDVKHEAASGLIQHCGALAAHGLGDQRGARNGERRRMELVELEFGELDTSTQRRSRAITGRDKRISRVGVKLPGTAAGENHDVCSDHATVAVGVNDLDTADPALGTTVVDHQVAHEGVLVDVKGEVSHGGNQRCLDCLPGGIPTGVDDASRGMRRLVPALEFPVDEVEFHAERDQVANPTRTLHAQDIDHRRVAQPVACPHGICGMRLGAVIGEKCRRNATLGVFRVALAEIRFGHQHHVMLGAGTIGGDQSSNSGADDDDPGHQSTTGLGAGRTASMRSSATRAPVATSAGVEI